MDPRVHEAYVGQVLAAQESADEVVISFQGGEPTMMGLEFFRRTLQLEEQSAVLREGVDDVRFACGRRTVEPGLHFLCAGYQRFFRHVDEPMRVMADLLRGGADATGIREWYAARDTHPIPDEHPEGEPS